MRVISYFEFTKIEVANNWKEAKINIFPQPSLDAEGVVEKFGPAFSVSGSQMTTLVIWDVSSVRNWTVIYRNVGYEGSKLCCIEEKINLVFIKIKYFFNSLPRWTSVSCTTAKWFWVWL